MPIWLALSLVPLSNQVDSPLKQHNVIDIDEYFLGSIAKHSSEKPEAKTPTVF
jgi:hypothetical protein